MTQLPTNPGFEDVLQEAINAARGLLHTMLPARVKTYNRTTQTAEVEFVVKGRRRDLDSGEWFTYTRKPVGRVPVAWLGGPGHSVTTDLQAGDFVIVLFAERDISQWLASGQVPAEPADTRLHDLSDAIAIPLGARPFTAPLDPTAYAAGALVVDGSDIRLGGSTATDFVALASKVLTELTALANSVQTLQTAYNGHTHLDPVSGSTGTPSAPVVTPVPTPASVAATTTKAV